MALVLAGLAGCGPQRAEARVLTASGAATSLNGPMEIRLDGPVDPLSVTARSVAVTDGQGRPLPARRRCARGGIVVELVVTPELLARPPRSVVLALAGNPSVHALATLDGRRLGRPARLRFEPAPVLSSDLAAAPRLLSVGGRDPALEGPLPLSEPLVLVFDAPLDPAGIRPEACPLLPVVEGLTLKPVLPRVSWRCIGTRFELELTPPPESGSLRLDLQLFDLRGLDGKRPGPNLQVELSAT